MAADYHYGYKAPPLKHRHMTLERVDKFVSTTYFSDVNLQSRLLTKHIEPAELLHFKAAGRFDFDIAKDAKYEPANIGLTFGPIWSTHWFRVKFSVTKEFVSNLGADEEVLFYWDTGTEATIWDEAEGLPIGAFSCAEPHGCVRDYYPVTSQVKQGKCLEFLVEVACNKVLGEGSGSMIGPPDNNVTYSLRKCRLSVRNSQVHALLSDLQMLHDIAKEMEDEERGYTALYTANEMVNILQSEVVDSYERALKLSTQFFACGNGKGQHVIHAVGHCHMDCAWLWPYDETKRKCSRSWSATLELMERYPDWTFACSSAQQYEWIQTHYPKLFDRIKESVKAGRFIPVGGSWVEMDGYLPSGESMCRQLLYGQRFFIKHFGIQCTEFWLPDTFGYSAQLPQIIRHFGMNRFFTQKISWNLFNKFPHHTFFWKGVDGSCVLSHFAPGESYHMESKVSEFVKTIKNFQDKGRSGKSLFLFGHGDGGQGPTEGMLDNLARLADVDGLPRVKLSTPADFFASIEEKDMQNLCTWSGELYLEMHNGTYTTQSKLKWYNRKCEFMLHNLEFLATVCYLSGCREYPFDELDALWKKVLLNQFHDVLPGSSVEIANDDAKVLYKQAMKSGQVLMDELFHKLSEDERVENVVDAVNVCNSLGWRRTEVVATHVSPSLDSNSDQQDMSGKAYQIVSVDGYSLSRCEPCQQFTPVTITRCNRGNAGEDVIILSNSKVYAEVDRMGRVTILQSITDLETQAYTRNLLSGVANQYTLYNDMPLFWDAWDVMDYHQETRKPLTNVLMGAVIREEGPLRASVEVSIKISDSSYLKQMIILDAESAYLRVDCEVNWHENRKFLKVEFPLAVTSDHVTYESQFGHIRRPTHRNTSWDSAKYEVCSQKWMDLSDFSSGVAILNDCKYGCSVTDYSTLSLSLLRAPKSPDANADMGLHHFSYAMMPHTGSFQEAGVIQAAHSLNTPLIVLDKITERLNQLSSDHPSVIIDTVKVAECDRAKSKEGGKCVILRCYESYGGSCQTNIRVAFSLNMKSVKGCDGLENDVEDIPVDEAGYFTVSFNPYQVKTFKILF